MLTGSLARQIAMALHTPQTTATLSIAFQETLREVGQAGVFTLLFTPSDGTSAEVCTSTRVGLKPGMQLTMNLALLMPHLQCTTPTYFTTPLPVAWGDDEIEAAMIAPLWTVGKRYGVLLLHDVIPPAEYDLLTFTVEQFGLALLHVQLGEEYQRRSALDVAKLSIIAETGQVLREFNLDAILVKLMELALATVAAEVGCIALRQADDAPYTSYIEWGLDRVTLKKLRLRGGRSLVEAVVASHESFVARDLTTENPFVPEPFLESFDSLAAFPLTTHDRTLGCLVVVNLAAVSEQDIELLQTVTELTSIAIENALLHQQALAQEALREQLRIAGDIQRGLLPKAEPMLRGVQLSAWTLPCDDTGGDYYDFFQIDEGRVGFVVGDAAGHGIGAALIATTVRALLRALVQSIDDLGQLLGRLNNLAEADFADDQFMTLFFGIYDIHTRVLTYASAGHRPPLLIYRHIPDRFEELTSTGIPLGIFAGVPYHQCVTQPLEVGDLMLLLTDGVDEAPAGTGERFGMERLLRIIRSHHQADPAHLIAIIAAAVRAFSGAVSQTDDITLLCLRVTDV
jgi:serine phosphatase RsbU (regulator of sigma subunit)